MLNAIVQLLNTPHLWPVSACQSCPRNRTRVPHRRQTAKTDQGPLKFLAWRRATRRLDVIPAYSHNQPVLTVPCPRAVEDIRR
jgi:hypothetical protein